MNWGKFTYFVFRIAYWYDIILFYSIWHVIKQKRPFDASRHSVGNNIANLLIDQLDCILILEFPVPSSPHNTSNVTISSISRDVSTSQCFILSLKPAFNCILKRPVILCCYCNHHRLVCSPASRITLSWIVCMIEVDYLPIVLLDNAIQVAWLFLNVRRQVGFLNWITPLLETIFYITAFTTSIFYFGFKIVLRPCLFPWTCIWWERSLVSAWKVMVERTISYSLAPIASIRTVTITVLVWIEKHIQ